MDQVKFVEDSFKKILKGCLPQILLGSSLNTLTQYEGVYSKSTIKTIKQHSQILPKLLNCSYEEAF